MLHTMIYWWCHFLFNIFCKGQWGLYNHWIFMLFQLLILCLYIIPPALTYIGKFFTDIFFGFWERASLGNFLKLEYFLIFILFFYFIAVFSHTFCLTPLPPQSPVPPCRYPSSPKESSLCICLQKISVCETSNMYINLRYRP